MCAEAPAWCWALVLKGVSCFSSFNASLLLGSSSLCQGLPREPHHLYVALHSDLSPGARNPALLSHLPFVLTPGILTLPETRAMD